MRALLLVLAVAAPASAAEAEAWLDGLYARVAADLRAGRPLVVQVHTPLCSNDLIRCGGHGLGDGDDVDRNLYWASSGGMRGWFERRGSGWTEVARRRFDGGDVLEEVAWRRRVEPGPAWRRRGVERAFEVVVVADAWRGEAIDAADDAYAADLFGAAPRAVALDDGTVVQAGGAAQVVAYVGHNHWMALREPYDWGRFAARGGGPPKGTIAIACLSADWLGAAVAARSRVPLVMTRDLLFAGAHSFDGAVRAFADGAPLAGLRAAAARAYADGQRKPLAHVDAAFTNPADERWLPTLRRAAAHD